MEGMMYWFFETMECCVRWMYWNDGVLECDTILRCCRCRWDDDTKVVMVVKVFDEDDRRRLLWWLFDCHYNDNKRLILRFLRGVVVLLRLCVVRAMTMTVAVVVLVVVQFDRVTFDCFG